MKTLVVVESPNKIAKISKCLGPTFTVVATIGHFRDLPERDLGVDVSNFAITYETLPGKEGVLSKLREAARGASEVLLGTDADREGEAIAWHVAQVLGLRSPRRIRFQELTPAALKKAVAAAGPLDNNLVDAQQARRVLDRLVGYQVSPLLSVFGPQHSAGRVQSAALHLVVEREKAREAFKPEAYWTVTANYAAGLLGDRRPQGREGCLGWSALSPTGRSGAGARSGPSCKASGRGARDEADRANSAASLHDGHAAAGGLGPARHEARRDDGRGAVALREGRHQLPPHRLSLVVGRGDRHGAHLPRP